MGKKKKKEKISRTKETPELSYFLKKITLKQSDASITSDSRVKLLTTVIFLFLGLKTKMTALLLEDYLQHKIHASINKIIRRVSQQKQLLPLLSQHPKKV